MAMTIKLMLSERDAIAIRQSSSIYCDWVRHSHRLLSIYIRYQVYLKSG